MTSPLDLDAIRARADAASPGPWNARPHEHLVASCRCLYCHEPTVGWWLDTTSALYCGDFVAKRWAAGERNEDGSELQSCDEGPLLPDADIEFAIHAREDVPALLAEVERLRAENQQLRQGQR